MEKPVKILLLITLACTFAVPALTFARNAPKEKYSVQQLLKRQQQEKKNLIEKHRFEKKTSARAKAITRTFETTKTV